MDGERRFHHWSDPVHDDPGHINTWDDGRGVYLDDPNGHRLEIITRPCGSGGTEARHPHPLIAPTIGSPKGPTNIHSKSAPDGRYSDRGDFDERPNWPMMGT
jgi:hypothetical protein